jgi:hypothetical protein
VQSLDRNQMTDSEWEDMVFALCGSNAEVEARENAAVSASRHPLKTKKSTAGVSHLRNEKPFSFQLIRASSRTSAPRLSANCTWEMIKKWV